MGRAFRSLSLGVVVALVLCVSAAAAGGAGPQTQIVVPGLWTGACSGGYVFESLSGAVTSCRPIPADFQTTEIAVAADGTIVGSGEVSGGSTDPVTLLRPDGQLVTLDSSPYDFDPSIAYDGSKVAFARWNPETNASSIYVVNPDGSDLQLVASGGDRDQLLVPTLSPDGSSIAYACNPATVGPGGGSGWCGPLPDGTYRSGGVMLMKADGSDKRMILIGAGDRATGVDWLSWSPNGEWLATLGSVGDGTQAFAYRTDGSDLFNQLDPSRQVTHVTDPWGPLDPQFCGDSTTIFFNELFDSNGNRGTNGWFFDLIDRDGTNRRQLSLSAEGVPWGQGRCVPPATGNGPPPTMNAMRLTVPRVHALGYDSARRRLRAAHFTSRIVGRRFSAQVRRGHVITQFPRAGARVHRSRKQGPVVKLVLSRGPRP